MATFEHCAYCFDVLVAQFEGRKHFEPEFENDLYPLFVTWNVIDQGQTQLRGCIGNFDALPLHSGLKEYAVTSAFHDRRFSPITIHELIQLECSVSLLTNFEDAKDYLDWEIGVHGIWIEFYDDHSRRRTSTYLPQVADDEGWTKVETIDSLLLKGGFTGKITNKVRQSIKLTRYQSSKYEVAYSEYLDYLKRNNLVIENGVVIEEEVEKTKRRLPKANNIQVNGFIMNEE